jgi:hypothetical protein
VAGDWAPPWSLSSLRHAFAEMSPTGELSNRQWIWPLPRVAHSVHKADENNSLKYLNYHADPASCLLWGKPHDEKCSVLENSLPDPSGRGVD